MKNKIIDICLIILLFLCLLVFKDSNVLSAETLEDRKWSFEFKDMSVPDILDRISSASDVEIVLNGDVKKDTLTRSYTGYTLNNILLDIFSGENHAVLFQYGDIGLSAVNIWVLPQGESMNLHSDIFNNNPYVSLPLTENGRTQKFKARSRGSNFNTVKNINEKKDIAATSKKSSYSSISFNKEESSTSENSLQVSNSNSGAVDIPLPSDTSETVDIIPLPEIVTTLGLEPPPMPPGMSFN